MTRRIRTKKYNVKERSGEVIRFPDGRCISRFRICRILCFKNVWWKVIKMVRRIKTGKYIYDDGAEKLEIKEFQKRYGPQKRKRNILCNSS